MSIDRDLLASSSCSCHSLRDNRIKFSNRDLELNKLTSSSTLSSNLIDTTSDGEYIMNAPVDSKRDIKQVHAELVTTEPELQPEEKIGIEEFTIHGDDLVVKIKELIHQGNIRRIILKNEEGRVLIEIPLTVGVVGGVISAALFPVMAAVGAIGAMVAHLTIVLEKRE
jgi:hypothetical protein